MKRWRGFPSFGLPAVVVLVAVILPFLLQSTSYSYVIRLLALAALYMLMALGLHVVVGLLGLLDLGFAAFYAIGAYTMALLSMKGWGFWPALFMCILLTTVVRALLGAPVLRLRGDYLAIVTLGFSEITRITLNNWDQLTNGPKGISLLSSSAVVPVQLFGWPLFSNTHFYFLILSFLLVGIVAVQRLKYSRIGRAWIAIREDETAARMSGIHVARMKMIGFAASAAFAGLAGGLFARWENFVTPESFTFWESVMMVAIVVIGGMGSIGGVIVGGAIVILVPEALRNLLGPSLASWRYVLFGCALIVMAICRPQGLWPSRRRARELNAQPLEPTQ